MYTEKDKRAVKLVESILTGAYALLGELVIQVERDGAMVNGERTYVKPCTQPWTLLSNSHNLMVTSCML